MDGCHKTVTVNYGKNTEDAGKSETCPRFFDKSDIIDRPSARKNDFHNGVKREKSTNATSAMEKSKPFFWRR